MAMGAGLGAGPTADRSERRNKLVISAWGRAFTAAVLPEPGFPAVPGTQADKDRLRLGGAAVSGVDLERRIIVGVHGSAASAAALRWAAREAELLGARLHAVRAWEDEARWLAPYAPHSGLASREEVGKVLGAELEQAVQKVLGAPGPVPVTVEVAEGLPVRVLLERADGAELLALGTAAGRAGDDIGPVARACLPRAPCPVVVVGADLAKPWYWPNDVPAKTR
jgi:nucleotide-binding universal stress UspA family protein